MCDMISSTDEKLKTNSSIHQDKKHVIHEPDKLPAHGVNEGANKKQDQLDDKADVNITEIAPLINADDEIVNEPEDEAGSPKYIDSGNVSPESLQMTISRENSRLSNITPTIAYSPESFLIEEEDN